MPASNLPNQPLIDDVNGPFRRDWIRWPSLIAEVQPAAQIEEPIRTPYDLYNKLVWTILDQKYDLSHLDDDQFGLFQQAINTAISATLLTTNVPNVWAAFTAPVVAKLDEMEAN